MDAPLKRQLSPACKFGPGGDFVSLWPAEPQTPIEIPTNRLTKLLNTISEIINTVLGSEFNPSTPAQITTQYPSPNTLYTSRNTQYEQRPFLFPTDSLLEKSPRTASIRLHKRNIRHLKTHKSAKKRIAPDIPGQGSLFETQFKKAISA